MIILAIAIIYLTMTITYHPITKWVCDGRKNTISYYYYDSSMVQITIEKEGKIVDRNIFTKDHINIWMFFGWPNGIWNLQWLELTQAIKMKTT